MLCFSVNKEMFGMKKMRCVEGEREQGMVFDEGGFSFQGGPFFICFSRM